MICYVFFFTIWAAFESVYFLSLTVPLLTSLFFIFYLLVLYSTNAEGL